MYRLAAALILGVMSLWGAEYPKLYASMGTPLFDSIRTFQQYEHLGEMARVNQEFIAFTAPVFEHGMRINTMQKIPASERKGYLEELRAVEAKKKWVMHHLTDLALDAVEADDYPTFKQIMQLPLDELLPTLTTRTAAIQYYRAKGHRDIPELDTLAAAEAKRRAAKRREHAQAEIPEDTHNPYRLKIHTPQHHEAAAAPEEEAVEPSVLQQIGDMFESMEIDFDPGLLEDYKAHTPPTIADVP